MISQRGYLSWPLIPGCNTFTATACNFLARVLVDANSSLSSKALSEIIGMSFIVDELTVGIFVSNKSINIRDNKKSNALFRLHSSTKKNNLF